MNLRHTEAGRNVSMAFRLYGSAIRELRDINTEDSRRLLAEVEDDLLHLARCARFVQRNPRVVRTEQVPARDKMSPGAP